MSSSNLYTQDALSSATFPGIWTFQDPDLEYSSMLIDPVLEDINLAAIPNDVPPPLASLRSTHLTEESHDVYGAADGLSKEINDLERILLGTDMCLADVAAEVTKQGICLSEASRKIDSITETVSQLSKAVSELVSTVSGLATTAEVLVKSEQHAMERFKKLVGELGRTAPNNSSVNRRNGSSA